MYLPGKVVLIAAVGPNGEIGYQGSIPFKIPGDMARFKQLTMGNVVIMGRKTAESLPGDQLLPGRHNIVMTGSKGHISEYIRIAKEMYPNAVIFIIGGASVYKQALPYADHIDLTMHHLPVDADTYFPPLFANTLEHSP